jgi:hypothetical protein
LRKILKGMEGNSVDVLGCPVKLEF